MPKVFGHCFDLLAEVVAGAVFFVKFLQVLNRARDLRPEGDDLLTILWEADLKYFTYSYIDLLAQGMDLDLPSAQVL